MTLDKVDVSESAHDIELSMSVPEARMHSGWFLYLFSNVIIIYNYYINGFVSPFPDSYSIKGKAMMVYKVKGSGTLE